MRLSASLVVASLTLVQCSSGPAYEDARDVTVDNPPPMDTPAMDGADGGFDVPIATDTGPASDVALDVRQPDGAGTTPFCSVGVDVPGAVVPSGFCVRQFSPGPASASSVMNPRSLAVAPNGDVFVSSPMSAGAGGGSAGAGGILILTDVNHDGIAEVNTFLSGVPSIHALTLAPGPLPDAVYFVTTSMDAPPGARDAGTDAATALIQYTDIQRAGYTPGMLMETGSRTVVMHIPSVEGARWTHGLARSMSGRMYVSDGVYGASCPDNTHVGVIRQVNASAATIAATGFRNPMYMRCHFADDVCVASELADDGGGPAGAREKLLVIHPSTDYGYPCCETSGLSSTPDAGVDMNASCASVTLEDSAIPLHDTPFGMDWERGFWPAPYTNALFLAKHGSFYSNPAWQGAGISFATTDPVTHAPNGPFQTFVGGFGPDGTRLDRPADVAFSSDGRMFFIDDVSNGVFWVAPATLRMPAH